MFNLTKIQFFQRILRRVGQGLVEVLLEFIQCNFQVFRCHAVSGGGLCSVPDYHHCNVILHVFSCKLCFEFNDFIVNQFEGFAYGFFIRRATADAVGTVGNEYVDGN